MSHEDHDAVHLYEIVHFYEIKFRRVKSHEGQLLVNQFLQVIDIFGRWYGDFEKFRFVTLFTKTPEIIGFFCHFGVCERMDGINCSEPLKRNPGSATSEMTSCRAKP